MEKTYAQKLDVYYMAAVAYLVTLIAYAAITGTLTGERFELVWKDPIVYLLALCAVVSLIALLVSAVLNKKVIIRTHEMVFITRFKERIIRSEDIEWIRFRRGSRGKIRDGLAEHAAQIKLNDRRRRLWLRPALFGESDDMIQELKEWTQRNNVPVRRKRRTGIGRKN